MPKLEYLMTYRADLKPPVEIGAAPTGTRRIFDVTGGEFEGPRLKGKILASGADWLLIGGDGVGRLDVRATFETHDGAQIYLQYHGVLVINEKIVRALDEGKESQYGDTYFMTQPRFETGDPRYAWLNSVVAVAEGRVLPSAVEYRVFQVVGEK
ncbi:DUF3237 domain-containing protein [bacterium]|nr:DUF3237 domain-containing protein [bacterium]